MKPQRKGQLHFDDHMSGNWSLGSHLCSQSRKISIGMVVDSTAKTKANNGKVAVQTSQNVTSAKDLPAESKHKGNEVISPDLQTQKKDTMSHPKLVSSQPSTSNLPLQPSSKKIVTETDPGPHFTTQMFNKNANEEKSKRNTYQSEGGNHGESSYVTPQKLNVPEKEQGTSTLRMKVQELLVSVYNSPNRKSETFAMNVNTSKPTSETNKGDSQQKRETNSGSLDRRPLTRSFTKKKPEMQKPVPKVPVRPYKESQNVFSFTETWSKRPNTEVDQGSKRKERDVFPTGFKEGNHKDEKQQATDDSKKRKSAAVNVSLFANRKGDSEMKDKTQGNKNTTSKKNTDPKHSLKNNVDTEYDFKSPTFELKTAPPRSLFQSSQEDLDSSSLSERSFKVPETHPSHSFGSSKGAHSNSNTKNLTKDPQDSVVKPATVNMGGHRESRCSRSSSKGVQSESSEDGSPVTVPVTQENTNGNKWPISPSQEEVFESSEDDSPNKGDGDCDKFLDTPSEQDGLAGAVKLFTLALQRVQTKMHSSTSKQSAQILSSVSKNIHSQLQNAESKIQNDFGKLVNLGKSKRIRTENQCQEQQEQLKRIYEKFKEEVDQHLEKCRRTLEGLEAHEIEVRGVVEKQRVSHRKLLLQTEEAIEAQLNDAQKRLSDVHRMARENMVKLKYGITECLKEGLLN